MGRRRARRRRDGAIARPRTRAGVERAGRRARSAPGGSTTDPRAELALAEARGREALAIDEENGDAEATAYDCLLLLSTLTRQTSMGESPTPPDAASLYACGQELFDRLGDDFGSGVIRITDAMLAIADGDLARADARVEAASPFVDRLGERFSTSRLEYVRGMLEALAGAPRAAYGHIEHSLRLANELGIHHAVTAQARLLVHLAERSGEDGLAAQWRSFVEGRGAGWTHYDASVMASAYTRVGMRARAHRQLARAESAHRAALDWYRAAGLSEGVALSESASGSSPSTAATKPARPGTIALRSTRPWRARTTPVWRSRWRARPSSQREPATRPVPPSCWGRREPAGRTPSSRRRAIGATSTTSRSGCRTSSAPSTSPG